RGVAQEEVERIYSTFVRRVADGRQMSVAQVDSIGQGRVWSGAQAKELGLVDALGGMDLALAEAAKLAKIEKYRVTNYPEFRKELFDFLPGFGIKAFSADEILKKELGTENYRLLERVRRLKSRQGVQAILPVEIDIR